MRVSWADRVGPIQLALLRLIETELAGMVRRERGETSAREAPANRLSAAEERRRLSLDQGFRAP